MPLILHMVSEVNTPGLPNHEDVEPGDITFPCLLDYTESTVDARGFMGLLGVIRRARAEKSELRLRLRVGSQFHRSFAEKGLNGLFRAAEDPILPLPDGVSEWFLLH